MLKIFVYLLPVLLCAVRSLKCEDDNPYLKSIKSLNLKSIQKYVEVRPGAYLFYWFYYADGTSLGADGKPLIIWIQGGPGIAASGVANFAEIGPLDLNMQPRNHTWDCHFKSASVLVSRQLFSVDSAFRAVGSFLTNINVVILTYHKNAQIKGRNLLLIDHPVGTGFSYATDASLLVKTDRKMVSDLINVIKAFFSTHKQFRKTPSYLFSQSYGGKLCPRLAFRLNKAIKNKILKMNLKGIGIGSGWVDPKESILAQPDFLYMMGNIDINVYRETSNLVKRIAYNVDKKNYSSIRELEKILYELYNMTEVNYNFNNVNKISAHKALQELAVKMNKYVKPTLSPLVNQNLQWMYLSPEVFVNLFDVMYMSTTSYVEKLLNKTKLSVAIYNGNLDAVTPLAGASNWVHKLKWHGADDFRNAKRIPITGEINGFYKSVGKLSFWSVFNCGHWVPEDNPVAMEQILNHVINED